MLDLHSALRSAMTQRHPAMALREVLAHHIQEGADKQQLNTALETLRLEVGEAEEDAILEVLDFLTAWCRPDLRL